MEFRTNDILRNEICGVPVEKISEAISNMLNNIKTNDNNSKEETK